MSAPERQTPGGGTRGRPWHGPAVRGQKRSRRSALQSGATRIGISVDEYMARIEDGQRWCSWHRGFEAVERFTPVAGTLTGVTGYCREGANERVRARTTKAKASEGTA